MVAAGESLTLVDGAVAAADAPGGLPAGPVVSGGTVVGGG